MEDGSIGTFHAMFTVLPSTAALMQSRDRDMYVISFISVQVTGKQGRLEGVFFDYLCSYTVERRRSNMFIKLL